MAFMFVTFFKPDDSMPGEIVLTPDNFTFEVVSFDDTTHGVTSAVSDGLQYVLIQDPSATTFHYDIGPDPEATVASPLLVMFTPLNYRIFKLQDGDKISFLEPTP